MGEWLGEKPARLRFALGDIQQHTLFGNHVQLMADASQIERRARYPRYNFIYSKAFPQGDTVHLTRNTFCFC